MKHIQDFLLDNPILVKHARSRLRPAQTIPWVVVVAVLCICILGASEMLASPGTASRWALACVLGLQLVLLVIVGGSQIATSVSSARASGILDFHRVTPLPPFTIALGYFLGAPIREYVLFACTLPFALMATLFEGSGLLGLLGILIPLVFGTWVIHALTLLAALATKKPKSNTAGGAGGGIVGVFMLAFFLIYPISTGLWFATELLRGEPKLLSFFGVPIHWLAFVMLYEAATLGFLFVGAVRKMRSDRTHAYSKRLAIACQATATVLALGAVWHLKGQDNALVLWLMYPLVVLALALTVSITPDLGEYLKGLRRASRLGQRRPSVWDDSGSNRVGVFVLSALVMLGGTIAWEAIEGRMPGRPSYSLTIATGVFTVAYFGLAMQYFALRVRTKGSTLMQAFIFLLWVVPLVAGGILGVADLRSQTGLAAVVASLSPVAGLALSAGLNGPEGQQAVQLAAFAPSITFAFVFNFLLVATQRKVDLRYRSAVLRPPVQSPFSVVEA